LAVAEKTWQSFSDVDKDAITRAARESADFSRNLVRNSVDSQIAEMEAAGATVTTPDIEPFREAVKSVYANVRELFGDDVDAILADAEEIRARLPAN